MSKFELKKRLALYLMVNCHGYKNRKKASEIMAVFGMKDHKNFRKLIEELRQEDNNVFICSEAGKKGGYWYPETYDEVQDTLDHLYKRAKEMLKTYSILKKKIRRRKDIRLRW